MVGCDFAVICVAKQLVLSISAKTKNIITYLWGLNVVKCSLGFDGYTNMAWASLMPRLILFFQWNMFSFSHAFCS